jgi:hypothetical protein
VRGVLLCCCAGDRVEWGAGGKATGEVVVSTNRLAVNVVLTFAWVIITWFLEDLVLLVSHKSGRVYHISGKSL